jgi:8-oxo-dGTP pyrophosphatase MutT (NUDIX family)
MSFSDSYLGRLGKQIGSELVLMPGAMIAVRRPVDRRVLLTRRGDDGTWCLPAGAAETGGSFGATAIDELKEEAGITVAENDLVPFATLSEAELHTIIYPNGDETHCFAVCFLAERWRGEVRPDGEETTKIEFADPASPPSPTHCPTGHALDLLNAYLRSGRFQVR